MSSERSPLLLSSNRKNDDNDIGGKNDEEQNDHKKCCANNANITADTKMKMTVFALACTVFVQSYLLEGVFPYSGFLTMHLLSSKKKEEINEETVGKYAGFVAGSFMAGRAVTAIFWGRIADMYGRILVLQASLIVFTITSLWLGFASTYWEACCGDF